MYRGFNVSGVKFNDDKGYSINSKIQTMEDELRRKGFDQIKKFSWQKTAQETLAVYKELL